MKDKIISILFVGTLFIFSILGLIIKDKSISSYERRKLTTSESLKEDFIGNLDKYLTDQFPFRDDLISINSIFDRYILMNGETNNVYIQNNYIIEKNYPLKQSNVNGFINKINYINKTYLTNSNVYYTIIPDKSYFLEDKYPKLDFSNVLNNINKELEISYIDIINLLELKDYYKTDIHIKQDSYFKIIKEFDNYLNFNYRDIEYEENNYNEFYGASYSKVSKLIKSEKLTYLSNDIINNSKVKHLEYGNSSVYDMEKLNSTDTYNIFLSGPSALIEIENTSSYSDKELIIFRDSFASSFTPLLIPFYKKITLIDLRYMNMDLVKNYVEFENKDILFAYSTLIANQSNLLKVNVKN